MTIKYEEFDNAEDFMKFFSPLNKDVWSDQYVFRGHGQASFVLAPSALRTAGPISARNLKGDYDPSARQVDFEIELIENFLKGCDASGIAVPGDGPEVRKELRMCSLMKIKPEFAHQWPPESLWHLMATAQHHGVPTCLLDWSRRSYVAAYFAASTSISNQCPQNENMAVWALNITESGSWKGLKYIEMPGATSQNLAAQDGVFTATTLAATLGGGNDSTTLDQLEDIVGRSKGQKPILIKALLPKSEAAELLGICAQFGVKGSTLFPGYEGVAKEVIDQAHAGIDFRKRFLRAGFPVPN